MSIDDSPAGKTGGQSGVSGPTTPELPEKLRVHALARLVGRTSKQVLSTLAELGQEARSAQSNVTRATAEQVIAALGGAAEAVPGLGEREATPAAAAAPGEPAAGAPQPEGAPSGGDTRDTGSTGSTGTSDGAGSSGSSDDTGSSDGAGSSDGTDGTDGTGSDGTPDLAALAAAVAPPAEPRSKRRSAGLAPVFNAAPMFQAPSAGSAATAQAADAGTTAETGEDERAERARPSGKSGRGKRGRKKDAEPAAEETEDPAAQAGDDASAAAAASSDDGSDGSDDPDGSDDTDDDGGSRRRRRRGRRGRGRGRGADGEETDGEDGDSPDASDSSDSDDESGNAGDPTDDGSDDSSDGGGSKRRRRRRRRGGSDSGDERGDDDPPNTVTKVREPREKGKDSEPDDGVQGVRGSTRLEAKRQRRRDGRDAGRRRPPILSESEFLARRESVDRSMVIRQLSDRTEIGVLEDDVLVEHFITGGRSGDDSMVGNIYLGRVQNVLPSMEAAFVDIGRGRNAVLYAGEVNWDAAGLNGKARKIEQALSSGDQVLVQVTKDPVGHKGARLTTQISLAGRFLVYVPSGSAAGISRKLPDNERKRLKDMLKEIVPSDAGVIIRTASEGVSHEALERDVRRLQAQWEVVKEKSQKTGKGAPKAPTLLYEEPDMLVKVVRDQFNEDFSRLIVSGDDAWDTVSGYVQHVAPELSDRMHRHTGSSDVFTEHRIDEQLLKALDRKVWLPSGGTLVIDRTEAMTVVDVNTGKFTGSGGNLEETVTRNNLEAAEEVVRQLRLRDIGGIIVVDFIDMVLEANRDLVLRRLTECLARDRTRHQVAEVTSLGLVQMTRKRVGGGLLEHFSSPCEHCRGRGVIVSTDGTLSGGHDHGHGGSNGNGNGQNGQNGNGQNGSGDGNGRRSRSRGRRGGGDRQAVEVDTSSAVAGVALVEAASRANRSGAETDASGAVETAAAGPAGAAAAASVRPGEEAAAVTPSVPAVSDDADDADDSGAARTTGATDGTETTGAAGSAGSSRSTGPAGTSRSAAEPAGEAAPVPATEPMPEPVTTPATAETTVSDAAPASGDTGGLPGGEGAAGEPAPRRRRGRVVRSAGSPAATTEPVVITTTAADPDPDPDPAAATPPAVAPQPEPSAVATRARRPRRTASRPAGPPPAEAEPGEGPPTGGNGESDPV